MELIEEIRDKETSWLLSWASVQAEYHIYMPYVLDELVIRAKDLPSIITPLVDILEAQTEFLDARKPMPSSWALQRVFNEGPDRLCDEVVLRANTWTQQKQEDLIMCGLDRENRLEKVAQWGERLGFIRKKTATNI